MTNTTVVRAQLDKSLAELMKRHNKLEDHLHNRDREVPQDSAERATFRENDEVLEALDDQARHQIKDIRAALKRLDDQSYGVCLTCGDDINPRRLEVLPAAPLCTSCATESD